MGKTKKIGFTVLCVLMTGRMFMMDGLAAPRGDAKAGRLVFRNHCTSCHGFRAKGDGAFADYLDIDPRNFTDAARMNSRTDKQLSATIHDGGPVNDLSVNMPIWGETLSRQQIRDVVAYIRDKHLSPLKLIPGAKTFSSKLVVLSSADLAKVSEQSGQKIEERFYRSYLYFLVSSSKQLGVVAFANVSMTSGSTINVGLAIDGSRKIITAVSKEEHELLGARTNEFLAQFQGFDQSSSFKVGKDIKVFGFDKLKAQKFVDQVKKLYFLTSYASKG